MKKFIATIVLMCLFVLLIEPAQIVLSRLVRLDEPETHEIQSGEWLSKLAQQYYGDVSYWKELALVNRAPNGQLIFPGEKVIIPSFAAIEKIRTSRSITAVNEVMGEQEGILAGLIKPIAPAPEIVRETPEAAASSVAGKAAKAVGPAAPGREANSSLPPKPVARQPVASDAPTPAFSTPLLTGIVLLLFVIGIGVFMYARKHRREQEAAYYGDTENRTPAANEDDEPKSIYFFDDLKKQQKVKRSAAKEEAAV